MDDGITITTEAKFRVEMPRGITDYGLRKIDEAIYGQYQTTLPYWWSVLWVDTQEDPATGTTYSGRFPRRVEKWLALTYGSKVPLELRTLIGNIASQNCIEEGTEIYIDFTQRFNWTDGEFADEGSCFWGENSSAKDIMRIHGMYAARFYDTDEIGRGRVWINRNVLPGLVIFNAYLEQPLLGANSRGRNGLLVAANILGKFFNLEFERLSLSNMGTSSGLVFINGGVGYHLKKPGVSTPRYADMEMYFHNRHCDDCGASGCDLWEYDDSFYCEECIPEW